MNPGTQLDFNKPVKKILVVCVNWVGDVIFSTPVFKALKRVAPGASLTCLAVPRVKDILQSCSAVDEVILYDEKGRHRSLWAKAGLVWRLRKERFDICFLLHRSWTRALLVYLAGIPERVGYDTKNRGKFLTRAVELDPEIIHRSDFYLHILTSCGVPVSDWTCELDVSLLAETQAQALLKAEGVNAGEPYVVMNAGGNWDLKRWPKENFADLVRQISEDYGIRVLIPGARKDVRLAEEIARLSKADPVILAGKTDLKQLLALLKKARLVVSSDSGPMHMANCVGTPVITVFGPTCPEVTGPRGKGSAVVLRKDVGCNRQACYKIDCPDNVCMKAVTVEEVMRAAKPFLSQHG